MGAGLAGRCKHDVGQVSDAKLSAKASYVKFTHCWLIIIGGFRCSLVFGSLLILQDLVKNSCEPTKQIPGAEAETNTWMLRSVWLGLFRAAVVPN